MISEAKLAANRANALLSKGPTSPEGRARSAQNALKHGMRSARLARFAETSYSFEVKQRKWMSIADPQNDIEEFIISQAAVSASKVQRVQLAEAEHAEHLVENADAIELGEIHDIGCCLFFDPCGPTALYGKQGNNWRKKRTSWRGEAIDPLDPKKLVDLLYSSAAGCRWMRERWEELAAHLEKAKGFWSSADKLRAIRLLGRQPIDAQDDVRVAAIFLASHAVRRTGKPFNDLFSDMGSETHAQFVKDVTDRLADEIDVSDVTKARQILFDLVAENVALIDEALERHERDAQKKGERSSDRLGFDESPRSMRIQQHEARCISGFRRGLELYQKWRKHHKGGERRAAGGGGSDEYERRLRPPDYGRATRAEGVPQGGGRSSEGVAARVVPWDGRVLADRDDDGLGGSGDLGADVGETGAGEWEAAAGAVTQCTGADSTGHAVAAQVDCSDHETGRGAGGSSGDAALEIDVETGAPEWAIATGAVIPCVAANGTRSVPATGMADGLAHAAVAEAVSSSDAANGTRSVPATKSADGSAQVAVAETVSSGEAADGTVHAGAAEAMGSGDAANGTRSVPATGTADSTVHADGAQIGCSDDEACGGAVGSSEVGGLENNDGKVTNEPNFEKEVPHTQNQEIVGVAAVSGGAAGLDKLQTNPRPVVQKTWQEERQEQWVRWRREYERRKLAKCERASPEAGVAEPSKGKIADAEGMEAGVQPLPRSP